MTETHNLITPRATAILLISRELDEVKENIASHRRNARYPFNLFHSQILVYWEQVGEELRRAARYLEEHDMSEGG